MAEKTEKPDGGPAFPGQLLGQNGMPWEEGSRGMSLRDWFAGMALQGLIASDADFGPHSAPHRIGERAYEYADAMLAERDKT